MVAVGMEAVVVGIHMDVLVAVVKVDRIHWESVVVVVVVVVVGEFPQETVAVEEAHVRPPSLVDLLRPG